MSSDTALQGGSRSAPMPQENSGTPRSHLRLGADRQAHGRSQSTIRDRMFEEVGRASSYQFNSRGEVGIASEDHDRKRKIPASDLFDQSPQAHAREVDRGKNASGRNCSDLAEKLFRAVVSFHDDGFARQHNQDVVAL